MTTPRYTALFFVLFGQIFSCLAQSPSAEKIQWLSLELAMDKYASEKKPIILDMYTDWCGFCKKLDAETFSDPRIIRYINNNFYAVKFDAESSKPVKYQDTIYTNTRIGSLDENGKPSRSKSHSLAEKLLNGRMAYPTIVYLVPEKDIVAPVPGYVTPEGIEPYLLFFADKVYEGNLFDAYTKGMKSTPIITP